MGTLVDSMKKKIIINLPLEVVHLFIRLKGALKRTSFAAERNIPHTTKRLNLSWQSTNMPDLKFAHIIYQFTCSCSDTCIGRRDGCLCQWMA